MEVQNDPLISNTIQFVKDELINAEGGHDWFHTERVFKNAMLILKDEKADELVVQLAALLHDIADSKFHDGDEEIGPRTAREFLLAKKVPRPTLDHVVAIIENISFKGGNRSLQFTSRELEIVQDADRLDAIGAIGIARTFNYGGFKNRKLYDPEILPQERMTAAEYKASTAPTINHFYEKLLLLKDRMHTETGKRLAQERHEFMEQFLAQFYAEWEGRR
ncbi:MAG: phosphohydrolase [Flavobacteriaceae bacterium]|nr:phosphohydrolase [Flavobacteriaceae bacterium]